MQRLEVSGAVRHTVYVVRRQMVNKQIVKTVPFDELPPHPVRSVTYYNELVGTDEVPRVIVYSVFQINGTITYC
jgi:hypothetical protein